MAEAGVKEDNGEHQVQHIVGHVDADQTNDSIALDESNDGDKAVDDAKDFGEHRRLGSAHASGDDSQDTTGKVDKIVEGVDAKYAEELARIVCYPRNKSEDANESQDHTEPHHEFLCHECMCLMFCGID